MILSNQSIFSDSQAVTSTAISDNVIDLGLPGTPYRAQGPLNQDIGKGTKIPVLIQVVEDFAGATSVEITIECAANADLSGDKNVVYTEVVPVADLVAGKQTFAQVLPTGLTERYLGLRYTVSGTATAGAITAGITFGVQTNKTGA